MTTLADMPGAADDRAARFRLVEFCTRPERAGIEAAPDGERISADRLR